MAVLHTQNRENEKGRELEEIYRSKVAVYMS